MSERGEHYGLVLSGFTMSEIKELLKKVREIEQRDPSKPYFAQILGMEKKDVEEVAKVLKDVFPKKGVGG